MVLRYLTIRPAQMSLGLTGSLPLHLYFILCIVYKLGSKMVCVLHMKRFYKDKKQNRILKD